MPSILSDLYYGKCRSFSRPRCREYASKLKVLCEEQDCFEQSLTERQKEQFHAYCEAYTELCAIGEREEFIEGFRLGARMTAEALGGERE